VIRPYELALGLRYTRARRRNQFISFITAASITGIALGVAALIVVISVMNGFERELKGRILGMSAHATVSGAAAPLADWPALRARLLAEPGVTAAAPFVEGEAMLTVGAAVSGVFLRGIDPVLEQTVSEIAPHMQQGELTALKPGGFGVVLGRELADFLGVSVGDSLMVIDPSVSLTPAGALLRERRFTVVGIYQIGMYEFDRGTALLHIEDAQRLKRLGDRVGGLRLTLTDPMQAPLQALALSSRLGPDYWVSDWTRKHQNFFRAIRTERVVMFLILSLIVAVAAFNIVSTLVMLVTDKQADIAILRTLGATPASVMLIFLIQGLVIGVAGTTVGLVGGVTLALNVETLVPIIERALGFQILPPDIYYISRLPAELRWPDVGRIAALSMVLSLLATLYPALRAARVQPAEALRYE